MQLFSIALTIGLVAGYSEILNSKQWQAGPRNAKIGTVYPMCTKDRKPSSWYGLEIGEMLVESMDTSFDYVADAMPTQALGFQERPKLIHTVGVIGEMEFVINGTNPWTGLFKSGTMGTSALIRLSCAVEPKASDGIVPGVSVKFFRDGVPSANLFTMWNLAGQKSFDFFANPLSNHPPSFKVSSASLPQQLLYHAFLKASKYPTMLGISPMAQHAADGTPSPRPLFPFRLDLHPNPALVGKIPSTAPSPFSSDYFLQAISQLAPPGTVLYDVYGVPEPVFPESNEKSILIGSFVVKTPLAPSAFGDKSLFFQHTRMEDDLKYHPEWMTELTKILDWEAQQWPPVRS